MDFEAVAQKLHSIAITSSTSTKEDLLCRFQVDEDFVKVLKFIYNPYITTGLKDAKLESAGIARIPTNPSAEYIMRYLTANNTGTLAAAEIANAFITSQATGISTWAAIGLVTKSLKIGVSATTINKVYGKGTIPIIGIMRGMHATEDNVHGAYIATEKIDGNRRIIMNKPTGVEIYTRSGRRDTGLVEIEKEVSRMLPKGFVYDTELAAIGNFADSIALRQASASIANRRGQKRGGVRAMVFDMLPQEEYDQGISKVSAIGRKLSIATLFNDTQGIRKVAAFYQTGTLELLEAFKRVVFEPVETRYVVGLPIIAIINTYQQAIAAAQPIWDTGGEGLMLVEWSSPYEVNPNPRKTLLKIKATKEYIVRCIDLFEGSGRNEGTLGSIYCKFEHNGETCLVSVGSGFADYQRDMYWNEPDLIVGHDVEIESFGLSVNAAGQTSLNCPIFKRVVGDND